MSEILETRYLSSIVRISAHDRNMNIPNFSSANFEINVPNSVRSLKNVVALSIQSVQLPHMFYNIYNATLKYIRVSDGAQRELVVDDGQYTIDQLMDHIVVKFNAYEANGAMVYNATTSQTPDLNDITQKLSLNFGMDIKIQSGTDCKLGEILGFSHDGTVYATTNNAVVAPYIFDLSGNDCVYIHSKTLSNGASDLEVNLKNVHSILAIPLDVFFGETAYYSNKSNGSNLIKFNSPRNITHIPISIKDNRGNQLSIQGADWTMVIKVYYVL